MLKSKKLRRLSLDSCSVLNSNHRFIKLNLNLLIQKCFIFTLTPLKL